MSKLIPKFNAVVKNKQFVFKRAELFEKYIEKFEGIEVVLTVKKFYAGRSVKQNNYYWLCLTHISNETGHDPEELHCTFKSWFLIDNSGKFPVVRSTTKLKTFEFMDYMEKIARRMSEVNIELPNPEEWNQLYD